MKTKSLNKLWRKFWKVQIPTIPLISKLGLSLIEFGTFYYTKRLVLQTPNQHSTHRMVSWILFFIIIMNTRKRLSNILQTDPVLRASMEFPQPSNCRPTYGGLPRPVRGLHCRTFPPQRPSDLLDVPASLPIVTWCMQLYRLSPYLYYSSPPDFIITETITLDGFY